MTKDQVREIQHDRSFHKNQLKDMSNQPRITLKFTIVTKVTRNVITLYSLSKNIQCKINFDNAYMQIYAI